MQLSNPQKPGYCGESKIYVIDWLELFLVSAESMHKNLPSRSHFGGSCRANARWRSTGWGKVWWAMGELRGVLGWCAGRSIERLEILQNVTYQMR